MSQKTGSELKGSFKNTWVFFVILFSAQNCMTILINSGGKRDGHFGNLSVWGVAACCHSDPDWKTPASPSTFFFYIVYSLRSIYRENRISNCKGWCCTEFFPENVTIWFLTLLLEYLCDSFNGKEPFHTAGLMMSIQVRPKVTFYWKEWMNWLTQKKVGKKKTHMESKASHCVWLVLTVCAL